MPQTKSTPRLLMAAALILLSLILIPHSSRAANEPLNYQFDLPKNLAGPAHDKTGIISKIVTPEVHTLEDYVKIRTTVKDKAPLPANYAAVTAYVRNNVLPKLTHTPAQNAVWDEKDGRIIKFTPDAWSQSFDAMEIIRQIYQTLEDKSSTLKFESITIPPEITLAEVNNLGITGLVATGNSSFGV